MARSLPASRTVFVAYLRGTRAHRIRLGDELADPAVGPFASLALLTPMLAAADGLYPLSHAAGTAVVDLLIVGAVVLGGWFTGQWIYRPFELVQLHPGYLLPSGAGGFIASASAALVGQRELAETLFGLGLVSWIMLGSIIFGRLALGPPLPAALTPTIAIEVAPAAVATFAVFVIDGQHVDSLVRVLAGYGVLMVIAQLRLVPAYRRLSFMPSTWTFAFAGAAVVFAGLFWLGVTHPTGWRAESYVALAFITALTGTIAVRTTVALARGQLLPAPAPAGTSVIAQSASPCTVPITSH
jgi:tellurite resistance protein